MQLRGGGGVVEEVLSAIDEGVEVGGVTVTRSSRYMDRARPITSKPGPMLAEEHGTSGCC